MGQVGGMSRLYPGRVRWDEMVVIVHLMGM